MRWQVWGGGVAPACTATPRRAGGTRARRSPLPGAIRIPRSARRSGRRPGASRSRARSRARPAGGAEAGGHLSLSQARESGEKIECFSVVWHAKRIHRLTHRARCDVQHLLTRILHRRAHALSPQVSTLRFPLEGTGQSAVRLGALATDAAGELNVLGHNGDALRVDRAEVCVLEQACARKVMRGARHRRLEAWREGRW